MFIDNDFVRCVPRMSCKYILRARYRICVLKLSKSEVSIGVSRVSWVNVCI